VLDLTGGISVNTLPRFLQHGLIAAAWVRSCCPCDGDAFSGAIDAECPLTSQTYDMTISIHGNSIGRVLRFADLRPVRQALRRSSIA
jgi:hypothetical protein